MSKKRPKPAPPVAAAPPRAWPRVGLILLLALGLRVTALGWGIPSDQHFAFHPDEIAGVLTVRNLWQDPSHLATSAFANAKGAGFFYVEMAALMAESKLGLVGNAENTFDDIHLARRVFLTMRGVTVAFSVGTALLVFLIGRRLFRPRVAELAALLEAVSPISVINAHYIKIDCAESFWVMLVLYFTARSLADRRWTLAAVFASGVAAAFKYPGGSAILFPLAAALLSREDRGQRLKLLAVALPLFAVGFFICFPSALLNGLSLLQGMGKAAGIAYSGSPLSPLWFIVSYPVRLMQGVGVVLPAWALAAAGWAAWRRSREGLLILGWLVPYYAVMASSAVVLVRYAVPMMPACALLMSGLVFGLAELKPAWAKSGGLKAGTAAAVVLILAVTLVHLRTMSRPDPRDLAGQWVQDHIPPGGAVAVTPTHREDESFIVAVNPNVYRVTTLPLRPDNDVSGYLDRNFKYLATNEKAWLLPETRHPSQRAFWVQVSDPRRWELVARFSNRPVWPGVLLRGTMPEDMYYLYQETRIYRRRG